MAQVCGLANVSPPRGFCRGIRNRVHYSPNHKIDTARQEQFERLIAKSPKPINTFLSFVSQFSPGTLRHPKVPIRGEQFNLPRFRFDDLVFSKAKP
jgi:hypothetical protein